MKKKICLIMLLLILNFLCSCGRNYEGYQLVEIPDDNIGSMYILENWEFNVVEGWINIVDSETKGIIAVEKSRGEYIHVGEDITDNREVNPYFDYVDEFISGDHLTGNSNNSQVLHIDLVVEQDITTYYCLYLDSNVTNYSIEFVFLDSKISQDVLIKISKSYDMRSAVGNTEE